MKPALLLALSILPPALVCPAAEQKPSRTPTAAVAASSLWEDGVVLPGATNSVQFRLSTNASPESRHRFNTFEISAYGETLLNCPSPQDPKANDGRSTLTAPLLDNVIVDGAGPDPGCTNGLTVLETAAGPDWRFLALDASSAYQSRLTRYVRGVLFVEPDLFVVYDHLVAGKPMSFQMQLHVPAATGLDTNWGDLHLDLPKARLVVNTPGRRRDPRSWRRIESAADAVLPRTTTMAIGPTNRVTELHVLTVFAVRRGGEKVDYSFKLLESSNAIGAQIQRNGLPTLVAFKTDPTAENASLTGFGFSGPVGVYVFKPKPRPSAGR